MVTSKLANIAATATAESHGTLTGRDAADSHTIGAITNLQTTLDGKQASLVSGTNIKTVNGTTLLGSGNLVISGGSGTLDGLTDTVITTATEGDVLYYDGTNWINDPSINNVLLNYVTIPISRQTNATEIKPISVGTTAPTLPSTGDLWVDTN
jgi:hypothetical protein